MKRAVITEPVDLVSITQSYSQWKQLATRRIVVCAGTGCVANGSLVVYRALAERIAATGLPVVLKLEGEVPHGQPYQHVSRSGCQGFCQMGPLVAIEPEGILYTRVHLGDVEDIVETTLMQGKVVERLLYQDPGSGKACRGQREIPFYAQQHRSVLDQCGRMDPEDIREYIYAGGYTQARRAYLELSAQEVCEEIRKSGLRGRGGGGFPTGRKWELTRTEPGAKKYVICNADEGDPGAFMDRSVMEGNPHSVIEGMMIAARAIGADEGYFYVRMEYPLAVERIRKAVEDAEAMGLLGDRLFGSPYGLRLHVMEGAGAFVCGEETAMIASIEGKRGMPRPKPPFPAQRGLWGRPTVINNVETLASVPLIMRHTAAGYRRLGTEKSPGTKTFALTGHVANTGLIEVPFGTTLRTIVFDIGGGVIDDQGKVTRDGFKAVQIGGPSGGCLTAEHLDLPLDFDSLQGVGAMIGSGGLVVMNRCTCMVQMARFFMRFTQNESCGKCVPCREGTRQMLALLDDIAEGRATANTLPLLEQVAVAVRKSSLCGLGKTAPNPVLAMLRYFREEIEMHALHGRCPTGRCKALAVPEIDPALCKGCTVCQRKCPVGAIQGERKQPHTINAATCIKCGACVAACKFNAITGI
jgi:NADH-quinone oxidoreductase subunit F